jgi:hypothetical protein
MQSEMATAITQEPAPAKWSQRLLQQWINMQ